MKNPLRLLSFLLLTVFGLNAFAADHPSNCTVKVASDSQGLGLVAIKHSLYKNGSSIFGFVVGGDGDAGKDTDPNYPSEYGNTGYDEYTFIAGSSGTCAYYIYARANEGCEFAYWSESETGAPLSLNAEDKYYWTHYSGTHSKTVYAHFRKVGVIHRETNNDNAGFITLSKDDALTGEEVTAKVTLQPVDKNNINMMSYFSHWELVDNETGSIDKKYDEEITFTAKPMTLRAIFETRGAALEAGKYYRVRNAYNRVLTIAGSFKAPLSVSSLDVPTSLLRWALPLDNDPSKFNPGSGWNLSDAFEPIWPEATPATIFYIVEGKKSGDNLQNVVLTGQGVDTYDVTGYKLNANTIDNYFGYYTIDATVSGQNVRFKAFDRSGYGIVNVSTPNGDPMVAFAIQPIDEAHVEDFWFGAYAEEEMSHEGGYWTSMYTAFPYKLYDDGIKAYYIKSQSPTIANGESYLVLEEIEDGIVPANSAVLLKCDEPMNTKANRMLPLNPSEVSKTLDGNILDGVFQLYESDPNGRGYTDTRKYNSDEIRVLGVNSAGKVGFFKLGGEKTLLKANKAYLDVTKLPAEVRSLSFKLGSTDGTTGIESVVEDGQYDRFEESKIYDLGGREVVRPAAGNIYIVNGKKVIWK